MMKIIPATNYQREKVIKHKLSSMVIGSKDRGYLKYWDKKMHRVQGELLDNLDVTNDESIVLSALINIAVSTVLIDHLCIQKSDETSPVSFNSLEKTLYVLQHKFDWNNIQELVHYLVAKYDHYIAAKKTQLPNVDDNNYHQVLIDCLIDINRVISKDSNDDYLKNQRLYQIEDKLVTEIINNYLWNKYTHVGIYRLKRLSHDYAKVQKKLTMEAYAHDENQADA